MIDFAKISNISSSIYFLIYFAYMVSIISDHHNKTTNTDTNKSVYFGLLITTLTLPIIYFAKKGIESNTKLKTGFDTIEFINRNQKLALSIYFTLVWLGMVLHLANADQKKYVSYAKLYILPILTILSFYLVFEIIRSANDSPLKKYKNLILFISLGLLYYTSIYSTLNDISDSNENDMVLYIQAILGLILFFSFGYISFT
jgi:hypothetical protein